VYKQSTDKNTKTTTTTTTTNTKTTKYRLFLGFSSIESMLRDGGSGYKAYVFKESTRRYAINRKG